MTPWKPNHSLLRGLPLRVDNPTITAEELLVAFVVDMAILRMIC